MQVAICEGDLKSIQEHAIMIASESEDGDGKKPVSEKPWLPCLIRL